MSARAEDPGWGPVIRKLPLLMVPVVGMLRLARETNGLVAMRILWVVFVNAIVLIGIVVVVLGDELEGGVDSSVALVATAGVGVLAQLLGPRFVSEPDVSSAEVFVASLQRWFFSRVAFAEVAALFGFVMFVLSTSGLVYLVGAAISLAGMIDAAPTRRRLAALQRRADAEGGAIDVLAVLQQGGLTR